MSSKRPNNYKVSHAKKDKLPESLQKVSTDLIRNMPPQNLDAEQAVLGGVFLSNNVLHSIVDILVEEDFYSPAHQIIFRTFLDLYRKNIPVDLVTIHEELEKNSQLDSVGGPVYLASLTEAVASSSNALFYAQIVKEKAIRRHLIRSATEIIAQSFEPASDVSDLLDSSEQKIFAISESKTKQVFRSSKELVAEVFELLQKRVERKELVTGVPTGYHNLDELTAGFQPTDLVIIAARPSMGKTAFALNVAMRAAVSHQVPTAIFSLEMSMEQLMMRMLCSFGKVDLKNLRTGYLDDEDWKRLYDSADALSKAPIYIDDTPALSSLEMRARCRRLKSEKNLGMVVVDYLQLMRAGRRIDSREQEISEISRSLKALAKEIKVPVLALSQLNRKVEERTNKRPVLSDLRESGAIEQDADLIVFLYRDDAYNKSSDNPRKGIAEIIVGKQRNGPVGTVELAFMERFTAFENLADIPPPSEDADVDLL
ncbi:MAG: replicative DNA helicase [Desulfonatronovibrio sp.]